MNTTNRYFLASLTACCALALVSCAGPQRQAGPDADGANGPPRAATLRTPRETLKIFHDTMKADAVPSALNLLDKIPLETPEAAQIRLRMQALARSMVEGKYDFNILEMKEDGDRAAAIIVDTTTLGSNVDIAPIYLYRRDGAWGVSPYLSRYDRLIGLSDKDRAAFDALARWYELRKAEWIANLRLGTPR